ncbi:MAG: class I SAM-dependent methyltransferase, partial [Acidobacteria bacterium]|nr:class I SAM-dependent methyltransferase [Acidobacteriota bacterium]
MPEFYNRAIQLTQRLALKPWLRGVNRKQVLDVGCGVGRWSRYLAGQGAWVTGVDLSTTMVEEATRRAATEGLGVRCRFLAQDLSELNVGRKFQFIVGVTVLQHILDEDRLRSAIRRLADHLAPDGRMVLIEAAPTRPNTRCDSAIFRARPLDSYLNIFAESGLVLENMTGVDPTPLKTQFLPYYRSLPRPLALVGLAAVTALSLPLDAIFGRRWVDQSWHKLFVL